MTMAERLTREELRKMQECHPAFCNWCQQGEICSEARLLAHIEALEQELAEAAARAAALETELHLDRKKR